MNKVSQSISIIRDIPLERVNTVFLYSIGKDSTVLLHLLRQAFYPAQLPFPLLHVDTGWKFREMYEFREKICTSLGVRLLTHSNPEGLAAGVNPFTHGSSVHTDIMKTQALKQALNIHGFNVVIGGARRDEEKSRAKERIFSFRSEGHRWDPKNQRPELWNIYNTHFHDGESLRVFPLSDWTEIDIWQYILSERLPIVSLYLAKPRPVVERNGQLMMVDDSRFHFLPGEKAVVKKVRFRTLGCYPLTAAIESDADTIEKVMEETLSTKYSERQGRLIDGDSLGSMEKKKLEGYF